MKKGFTLIELLIVIAIFVGLSTFGMIQISAFQKDAQLDSVTNEIISTLKVARNKSQLGEVPIGMSLDDFTIDGLPSYGVRSISEGYEIYVHYKTAIIESTPGVDKSMALPDSITLIIPSGLLFERISGKLLFDKTINIKYKGVIKKNILINSSGVISVADL